MLIQYHLSQFLNMVAACLRLGWNIA